MAAPRSRFPRPLAHVAGPREIVRQFTPNWFTATMGTGILALALNSFSPELPILHAVGRGFWLFNIGLFLVFSALYAARWIFFFDGALRGFGAVLVGMLAVLWAIVAVRTALGAWTGKLFFAPCLMSGEAPLGTPPAPESAR